MGAMSFQITSLAIVYSAVQSGEDQRKHQSSASLAFVRGIHRGPVNSPHKCPVTRNMFPFDDVIMKYHISIVLVAVVLCWLYCSRYSLSDKSSLTQYHLSTLTEAEFDIILSSSCLTCSSLSWPSWCTHWRLVTAFSVPRWRSCPFRCWGPSPDRSQCYLGPT